MRSTRLCCLGVAVILIGSVLAGCTGRGDMPATETTVADGPTTTASSTTAFGDTAAVSATTTVSTDTTKPATTTMPTPAVTTATTTSIPTATATTNPPKVFCRDLAAQGYSYREALDFWVGEGAPDRMDADLNGIPCETVFEAADVATVLAGLAPTTTGEVYPEALSRDLVPWSRVGPGWYLATFIGSDIWGESAESMIVRPSVLYLMHQSGRTYELDSWPGRGEERWLQDWSPDGRFALMKTRTLAESGPPSAWEAWLVDLRTLTTTVLATGPNVDYRTYAFTKPTGRNIVELEDNWETSFQQLRRINRDGSEIAVVAAQIGNQDWYRDLHYLYHHDGTGLVLSDLRGLSIVRNDGSMVRSLWRPEGMWCLPEHWYDATTIAGACYSEDPTVLPHSFFAETWLIPTDGSEGSPATNKLTARDVADEGFHVGHEGFHGAWPTPDGILVQGVGDCSTLWIEVLNAERESVGSLPGQSLVGVHNGIAVIRTWQACDATPGSLIAATTSGEYLYDIIRAEDPIGGIRDVFGLAAPYP